MIGKRWVTSYVLTVLQLAESPHKMSARSPRSSASANATAAAPPTPPAFGVAAFNASPLVQSLRKQNAAHKQAAIGNQVKTPDDMIRHIEEAASVRRVNKGPNRATDRAEIIAIVKRVMQKHNLEVSRRELETRLHMYLDQLKESTDGASAIKAIYDDVVEKYTYRDADSDTDDAYKSAVEARFRFK